ncbi:MAG TPA: 3-dehydroquinate synthase [Pyrinomonadaceae bacterium]|nr:3-dehydroquinate synthase [Pyrinomonadaceae bacterium]
MKKTRRVSVRLPAAAATRRSYEIEIGAGALDHVGDTARRALSTDAQRVAVVSNQRVFALYGARVVRTLRARGFKVSHWLMGDGERHKNLRTAERALAFFSESKLERTDAVVALGGGVVGDLAGFAAAVYLRGIACMQVPTTLLAQIDASVGGKTAVNTRDGKNLIGAFHQPRSVVISTDTLRTLRPRELTAGWCEAIKQGAVGDLRLFEKTRRFLVAERGVETARALERTHQQRELELASLIAAQCAFKAKIVAGDEREDAGRTDALSRRILNFGHTAAHALEAVTRYRRFRHGEAVGYGMIVAGEISERLGMLDASELESLRACVRLAGRLPRADDLDERAILRAIDSDKKSIGGHVRWVLLDGIGRARIVSGQEVAPRVVRAALRAAVRTERH